MKKIGQFLKNEREKQGLSLEYISSKIKVHAHKLRAIEENQRKELPAKVFIIGLIKSYAKELKLDIEEVNQLCKEFYKDEISNDNFHLNNKTVFHQLQWLGLFQIPKKIAVGISLLIILVLLIIIFSVIIKINGHEESIKESMESYPAPQLLKKPKETQEKKQAAGKDNIMKEDQNMDPIKTKKINEKKTANNPNNKLIIKALRSVQVEIIWSDGYVQKISLKDQKSKTFVFSKPIRIKISNGNAVLLSFNKDKDKIPGTSDQPIELNYP